MNICFFVCVYVCMELTQINISEPIWTKLCTCVPHGLVCMDPKFLTSLTFWAILLWGPLQNHGHKMAAGATVICDALLSVIPAGVRVTSRHYVVADGGVIRGSLISVILAGVSLTSRKWRCSRRQSSATASYPLFRQVFTSRHGYYVQPCDRAIHHSVISLIPCPVSVTHGKSRPCRQQLRVPTASVFHCR
jgi:hypothetical protein